MMSSGLAGLSVVLMQPFHTALYMLARIGEAPLRLARIIRTSIRDRTYETRADNGHIIINPPIPYLPSDPWSWHGAREARDHKKKGLRMRSVLPLGDTCTSTMRVLHQVSVAGLACSFL